MECSDFRVTKRCLKQARFLNGTGVVSTVVSGIPFARFPSVEQISKGFV